jgi:hypothetical protein
MTEIATVDQDRHADRLVEDHLAGRLTVQQLVRLAMAVGRVQSLYMSAIQLATEAGIVAEFNTARKGATDEQ